MSDTDFYDVIIIGGGAGWSYGWYICDARCLKYGYG